MYFRMEKMDVYMFRDISLYLNVCDSIKMKCVDRENVMFDITHETDSKKIDFIGGAMMPITKTLHICYKWNIKEMINYVRCSITPDNSTHIYKAYMGGHNDLIMECDIDDASDRFKNVCFGYACCGGHEDVIEKILPRVHNLLFGIYGASRGGNDALIDKMMKLTEDGYDNQSRLEECLRGGARGCHIELVRKMLDKGAIGGEYGFISACQGGDIDIVKLLFERGSGLEDGYEAGLYVIGRRGHRDLLEYMLKKLKCERDKEMKKETREVMYDENPDMYGMIGHCYMKYMKYYHSIMLGACKRGDIEIVKMMMRKGVTILDGCLEKACHSGNIKLVKLLLKRGCKCTARVLGRACKYGRTEIIDIIISRIKNPKIIWDAIIKSKTPIKKDILRRLRYMSNVLRWNKYLTELCKKNRKGHPSMRTAIEMGAEKCYNCNESAKEHI